MHYKFTYLLTHVSSLPTFLRRISSGTATLQSSLSLCLGSDAVIVAHINRSEITYLSK